MSVHSKRVINLTSRTLLGGISSTALAISCFIAPVTAFADGGYGGVRPIVGAGPGGKGGVDGSEASAIGEDGSAGTFGGGSGGGGGGVNLETGFGAHGGSMGAASNGTKAESYGATGVMGQAVTSQTTITTSVSGGTGGLGPAAVGSAGDPGNVSAGGHGGGGVGISASADLTVANGGVVTGGTGGGANTTALGAGGGGGGGVGIFSSGNVKIDAGGTVVGGTGGHSGNSGGGGGAAAVVLSARGNVLNSGSVAGGVGGGANLQGAGGGGAGVVLLNGGTVTNLLGGSISGGAGGSTRFPTIGQPGLGGEGIKGADMAVVNAGSITGALAGGTAANRPQANAITFTGGTNSLELWSSSDISGNVQAFSTADRLMLGGSTDAVFDVTSIGDNAQYRGFGQFEKTGTSSWTLTGSTTAVTPWTLTSGILSIAQDESLGDVAGILTFNGGTLRTTASFASDRDMVLNSDAVFDTASGTTLTANGAISGPGGLNKTGDGIVELTGVNTYGGVTAVAVGTLALTGSGSIAASSEVRVDSLFDISGTLQGASIQSLSGVGVVELGSEVLTLTNASGTFAGEIKGAGGIALLGGTQTLSGINSYTGNTDVSGGTLRAGAANALSPTSAVSVRSGATVDLNGYDQTLQSLANAGLVRFGEKPGTTLTISGNYTGNGGTLSMATVLGGDNSQTDRLMVRGNTSGTTQVAIVRQGGLGAQTVNGIKIVDVSGQSGGTFSLLGDFVTKDGKQAIHGGAYAYTLQQGGMNTPNDGNWYLTSEIKQIDPADPDCNSTSSCPPPTARYSPSVPVYEGYLQNMQALNKLPTLQERVGERYRSGQNTGAAVDDKGVWARIEGAHNRLEPDTSLSRMKQDINTFIMQAGVDGQFYESDSGKLIAGITGQYGHAKGDVSSFHGDGAISTDGWSLGATATWYGNSGFYVDGQAQVTWFDSDLTSWTANQGLADGRKATGYALSIEAGQRIAIDQNWSLTPQAQLMYSSINADSFRDAWDSRVSLHDGDSLIGRLGLAANYANSWKGEDGLMVNTTVYGIANLYQEMLGGSSVNVAGVDFDTDNDRTWGGIGAGGTYAWADNKYAVYGEGSINTALNHFADSYALKGTVGFKVKW